MAGIETQSKTPRRPEKGHEAGLITLASFEPSQVDGGARQDGHTLAEYRLRRFKRRAEAQRREVMAARAAAGLDPNGREGFVRTSSATFCGRPLRGVGGVSVKVTESGRAHYSGAARCGRVWLCPCCAQVIRRERGEEIAEALRRHLSAGGGVLFVTTTVRHGLRDALADTNDVLSGAWARCNRSRAFRSFKAELGMVGYVTALEVTYGRCGWHSHQHRLVLTEAPIADEDVPAVKARFFSFWRDAVEAVGGTCEFDAFDLRKVSGGTSELGRYVTKLADGVDGLGREITLGDLKSGRVAGSVTPFQMLDDSSPASLALWQEYVQAMRGRSAIRWSRGLRDRLGLGKERTDEQVAQDADSVGEVSMVIDADVFAERVARKPQVMAGILEAVERHDLEAAARLAGVPLSWEAWPGGELMPRLTRRPSRLRAA